ncbi:MAG: sortase, partial [Anaerolineae bacterium]
AIGVDARVVEVGWHVVWLDGEARGMWETVAGAVGHHRGSAYPGERGNCVLSAHSSEAGGAIFRRLNELSVGDVVQLYNFDEICYNYSVTSVLILDEAGATAAEKREHAAWLDPTDDPVLTLVTCWPDWAYTHRIIVRAALHAP